MTYINAEMKLKSVHVHLEQDPGAQVYCDTQGGASPYAVIHLGGCVVFPSDAQVLKLEAALREYIDSRAIAAEAAATGAQSAFEIEDRAAAIAADSEPF